MLLSAVTAAQYFW